MTELRWILLGLGVLFCVGLWWWESRRGRQATDANADLRAADPFARRNEPARDSRRDARAREPVQRVEPEIGPGLTEPPPREPLRVPEHELVDEKLRIQGEPEIPPRPRFPAGPVETAEATDSAPSMPDGRIEPTVDVIEPEPPASSPAPQASAPAAQTSATPPQVSAAPPVEEKIVTIRVASPPLERFEGSALVRALGEAGLQYGRFSIFHRVDERGETVFSVASLVEPGTFDLQTVQGKRYPGVSFFTVLRRPDDALEVFDEMLNTARDFAHQMRGTLQDDRGATLSLQRLSVLRDEVAAWQKAALRSRAS